MIIYRKSVTEEYAIDYKQDEKKTIPKKRPSERV